MLLNIKSEILLILRLLLLLPRLVLFAVVLLAQDFVCQVYLQCLYQIQLLHLLARLLSLIELIAKQCLLLELEIDVLRRLLEDLQPLKSKPYAAI